MRNIGLFGLTGNPPHIGHLRAVEDALLSCERVFVTPVFIHPFNKEFIEYEQRLKMITMLFQHLKSVDIIELDKKFYMEKQQIPYSYDLLTYIKQEKSIDAKLIIGEDNYKKEIWEKFYSYDKIDNEFGVIVIKDSGEHSTQIRDFCKNKDWINVEKCCSPLVTAHIRDNLLYI
ncbi:hypothetical protein GW796_00795 [archaeon]|nr:hypothetical protein [archaeon]NCQ50443.1 hypothetical protein [archaeon]